MAGTQLSWGDLHALSGWPGRRSDGLSPKLAPPLMRNSSDVVKLKNLQLAYNCCRSRNCWSEIGCRKAIRRSGLPVAPDPLMWYPIAIVPATLIGEPVITPGVFNCMCSRACVRWKSGELPALMLATLCVLCQFSMRSNDSRISIMQARLRYASTRNGVRTVRVVCEQVEPRRGTEKHTEVKRTTSATQIQWYRPL